MKKLNFLHKKNMGAGPARNNGIQKSTGKYISFLDADDFYPNNNVLLTLYNCCEKNKINIAGGELAFYKNGDVVKSKNKQDLFDSFGILEYKDFQYDYGFYRYLYSANFIKENSIAFPDLKRFQDPIFFVEAMFKSKKFFSCDIISYCYRYRPESVEWTEEQIISLINGIGELLLFSSKNNLKILHKRTFYRLKNDFYKRICESKNKFSSINNTLKDNIKFVDCNIIPQKDIDCIYEMYCITL